MFDVGIIGYGMGNLRSVFNAFEMIGATVVRLAEPAMLTDCRRIVLPGVGAFPNGMANLRSRGWIEPLERCVHVDGMPFPDICLGMQLLASIGHEHEVSQGLGWIRAEMRRLEPGDRTRRIPHIGGNDVEPAPNARLYQGIADPAAFYFVHSYALFLRTRRWSPVGPITAGGSWRA